MANWRQTASDRPVFEEHLVSVGSHSLNLASSRNHGPPILFLHGIGRIWSDFATLFPTLLWRWQILSLDFRGHGKSTRDPANYLVIDYVADVVNLLQQIGEPTVVYGHSLGALVAAAVAAEVPELVRGVVLEDPPSPGFLTDLRLSSYHQLFREMQRLSGDPRPIGVLAREFADLRLVNLENESVRLGDIRDGAAIRFTVRCLKEMDPNAYIPLLECRWLEGYNEAALGSALTCPTLLLCADESVGGMLPKCFADQMERKVPDLTRVDLPKVNHLIHWMAPKTTLRLIHGFVESLL